MAARFRSRIGREHWEFNRTWYRAGERNRHDRRFGEIVEILGEEYQKAVRTGEALQERSRVPRNELPTKLVISGAAAVIGIVAGVLLSRRGGRA